MAHHFEKLPTHNCNTCRHCQEGYCCYFQRPVDVKFNKCLNHNKQLSGVFKANKNLEVIMAAEEAANKKHYKEWLAEDEKMRAAIRKDIEAEQQRRSA